MEKFSFFSFSLFSFFKKKVKKWKNDTGVWYSKCEIFISAINHSDSAVIDGTTLWMQSHMCNNASLLYSHMRRRLRFKASPHSSLSELPHSFTYARCHSSICRVLVFVCVLLLQNIKLGQIKHLSFIHVLQTNSVSLINCNLK